LFDSDCEEFRQAPGAIRMIRNWTARTGTDLNMFGIIHSTLITLNGYQPKLSSRRNTSSGRNQDSARIVRN
jgi:hypothetical protein